MLSAVVITKNEEVNIGRCLSSLSFCDEIIVVDAESEDSTLAKASQFTSKLFVHPWKGYVGQRNYANSLASHDWILSIDADEEVSEELKAEILELLGKVTSEAAYSISRKTIHSGRWIKHGGWYPNRLLRLFKKSKGEWRGGEVHEYWYTESNIGILKNDLIHYSFDGIADQVERNNHYSTLGAKSLFAKQQRFSTFRLLMKTASKFVETYFLKFGFLDGYPGFIISISAAYSVFLKWVKLWELEQHASKA